MGFDVVEFIPSDHRLKIVKQIIENTGIRPLARKIEVNPKSVYKYKTGESSPGNTVMKEILKVAREEYPGVYEESIDSLKKNFIKSLETSTVSMSEPESSNGETVDVSQKSTAEREETVDREETVKVPDDQNVDQRTTNRMSFEDIYDSLGMNTTFSKMKIRKILRTFSELSEVNIKRVVDYTGLSEEAVENYVEILEEEAIVIENDDKNFELKVSLNEVG